MARSPAHDGAEDAELHGSVVGRNENHRANNIAVNADSIPNPRSNRTACSYCTADNHDTAGDHHPASDYDTADKYRTGGRDDTADNADADCDRNAHSHRSAALSDSNTHDDHRTC